MVGSLRKLSRRLNWGPDDVMSKVSREFSRELYNHDGYTGPIQVLDDSTAAEGRRMFYAAVGMSENEPGQMEQKPGGFDLRYRWAYDLATTPLILDHIEELLGPDIVLWATAFWYKPPRTASYIPWHQDATYWPMTPRVNLSVWIAMGPTFRGNGCLSLIPGSHGQWMDDQYRSLEPDAGFSEGLMSEQVDEGLAVHLEMDPGEAVFFTEATLHRSDANVSDVPRLAFALRFTTPEVVFDVPALKEKGIDYLARSTIVRGEDRYRLNDAIRVSPACSQDGKPLV